MKRPNKMLRVFRVVKIYLYCLNPAIFQRAVTNIGKNLIFQISLMEFYVPDGNVINLGKEYLPFC